MKISVVQFPNPAAPGNYDFTDSSTAAAPNSDLIGSWFWEGIGQTAANTSSFRFSFGACDLYGNNINLGFSAADATSAAPGQVSLSVANCLSMPGNSAGTLAPVAAFHSALANGVRLTASSIFASRIANCALLSGNDWEMEVGNVQFASGDTNHTIAFSHLHGKPDFVILLIASEQTGGDNVGAGGSIGWYERTGGAMASQTLRLNSGANPTDFIGQLSSLYAGQILSASAVLANVTVDTLTTGGFRIHYSAAAGVPSLVGWIACRGQSQQINTQASVAALPTSTPLPPQLVSGMQSPGPLCVLAMPGRFNAKDTLEHNDQAGHVGMCVAATPDRSATSLASATATFEFGLTGTSQGQNKNTLGRFLSTQADAGTDVVVSTVGSWDSTGLTPAYAGVDASGIFAPVLAFGMPLGYQSGSYGIAGQAITVQIINNPNINVLLGSGTYDITGAPLATTLDIDLDSGLYQIAGENLFQSQNLVNVSLDCGTYSIRYLDADVEELGPPPVVVVPFQYLPVTGRQIPWDAVVRMAGGITQPHPYETYRFGGGAVQRSFFENV